MPLHASIDSLVRVRVSRSCLPGMAAASSAFTHRPGSTTPAAAALQRDAAANGATPPQHAPAGRGAPAGTPDATPVEQHASRAAGHFAVVACGSTPPWALARWTPQHAPNPVLGFGGGEVFS